LLSASSSHLGASLVSAHAHATEAKKSDEDDTSNDGGDKSTSVGLALLLGVIKKGGGELGGGLVVKGSGGGLLSSSLGDSGLSGISSHLRVDLGDGDVDNLKILTVLLGAVDTSDVHLTSGDWELTGKVVGDKRASRRHAAGSLILGGRQSVSRARGHPQSLIHGHWVVSEDVESGDLFVDVNGRLESKEFVASVIEREALLEHSCANSADLTGSDLNLVLSAVTVGPHGSVHTNNRSGLSVDTVVELNALDGGFEKSLGASASHITVGGASFVHVLSEEDLHTGELASNVSAGSHGNGSNSSLLALAVVAINRGSVEIGSKFEPVNNSVSWGRGGEVVDDGVVSGSGNDGSIRLGACDIRCKKVERLKGTDVETTGA